MPQEETALDQGALEEALFGPCFLGGWSAAAEWHLDRGNRRAILIVTAARVRRTTVFRFGEFRFFFFSREEERPHIHVEGPGGEAKFWIEPTVELAMNWGLRPRAISKAERIIRERQAEIRQAWDEHFGA